MAKEGRKEEEEEERRRERMNRGAFRNPGSLVIGPGIAKRRNAVETRLSAGVLS